MGFGEFNFLDWAFLGPGPIDAALNPMGLLGGAALLGGGFLEGGGEGAAAGGGIFEGLVTGGSRAGAAAEGFTGAAEGMAAGEGLWVRLVTFFEEAVNLKLDYDLLRGATKSGWQFYEETHGKVQDSIKDVVNEYNYILQQLKAHAGNKKLGELSNEFGKLVKEYEGLGFALPDEALLKRTYRTLSKVAHPDMGGPEKAFKALQQAYEILGNAEAKAAYEKELARNPGGIKDLYAKLESGWEEAVTKAATRKQLTGTVTNPKPVEGFSKWLGELSPNKKAALIFAGIAGIGIGTMVALDAWEKRHNKKDARANTAFAKAEKPPGSHRDMVRDERYDEYYGKKAAGIG